MKKTAVALGITLLVACSASDASAAVVEKTSDRGNRAEMSMNTSEPVTCTDGSTGELFSSVVLVARENVTRATGNRVSVKAIELLVSSFNTCDFSAFAAFGSTEVGTYAQTKTSSARVAASVQLFDQVNGMPLGTADVDVTFTGTSSPTRTTTSNRSTTPGSSFTFRSTGSFNEATVAGSVTLNGTNLLTSAQSVGAQLGANTTGTSSITRAK